MQSDSLHGIPETMLQTLYARARESMKPNRHFYDEKAVEIFRSLDYDFSRAEQDPAMYTGVVARTLVLDRLVRRFLDSHPNTVVINIACGLDTRCCRMKGRFRRWYNLDLPEVIEIRRRFFDEDGPVFQIGMSAMELAWTAEIQQEDEPVLVIIEGLSMYLQQSDVQQIFRILDLRFAHATVLCEVMSPFAVRRVKEKSIEGSGARFTWGVRSGEALAALLPGWQSLGDHSLTEGMKVLMPVYRLLDQLPPVRNISNKIVVLEK